MNNFKLFAENHGITLECWEFKYHGDDEWKKDSFAWGIKLTNKADKVYKSQFYKGKGHIGFKRKDGSWRNLTEEEEIRHRHHEYDYSIYKPRPIPPTAEEFLECVQCSCQSISQYHCFPDWADDLGYNPDSIKHKAIYEECCKEYSELEKFLGCTAMKEFISITED